MVNEFETREEASAAVARLLAERLRSRLAMYEKAGLIVSGGSSPLRCYDGLSREKLDWSRVHVLLTDERCVPAEHEASNERMLRENLLINEAEKATFVPLNEENVSVMHSAFAAALVGMGEDGHFASIFPDNPDLARLLDPVGPINVADVKTAVSDYGRRTVSLSFLLNSEMIFLLAFGETKKNLLCNPGALPVSALIRQQSVPVSIFWAA